MKIFELFVSGVPRPQGSKIPGMSKKTGKMYVRESSIGLQVWRELVKWRAKEILGVCSGIERGKACCLKLDFYFSPVRKRDKGCHCRRPDLSKLVRAVEDSLVCAGVVYDDSQIARIEASKYWDKDKQGVQICLETL